MIGIVTIEREYGGGGAAIGRALAERLQWRLWDESLTAKIAGLAPADVPSKAWKNEWTLSFTGS